MKKAGSEPRLIGDSSISNANHLCRIQERVELPSLHDVSQFVSRHPTQEWTAFSLDIAKAHKRIRVHPSEQGFSLFNAVDPQGEGHWLIYHTCHFGCAWAAYWWSRAAAAYIRCLHILLHKDHFLAIYVDDLLGLFPKSTAPIFACLCIMLACAMGLPLSWHKLQLCDQLKWIGWELSFGNNPSAALPVDKLKLLSEGLQSVARRARRVPRKELQALIGRLVWFTSGAHWLRPWLQWFFRALNKPGLHFLALDPLQLEELSEQLSSQGEVVAKCRMTDVQLGWRLAARMRRQAF